MADTEITDGPAPRLQDVAIHHHPAIGAENMAYGGVPAPTLCGTTHVKRPDALEIPCCPLCRFVLDQFGIRCQAEGARHG